MVAAVHPNSRSSGTMSTPGVDRTPDAVSSVKKVTPKTIHA
jgi:hypothetical protein